MSTHTPAPWQAGPVFQKEGRALFITDQSKPGKWQRRLDDKAGVFSEADAALIAAAPDLLAALELILSWPSHKNMTPAFDKAVEAVAKAKGTA